MSEENLAATRRFISAFNDRDLAPMAAESEDDSEFYPLRAQFEQKAYVGRDGLEEMFADFDQDWDYVRFVLRFDRGRLVYARSHSEQADALREAGVG
jgi:hypothetical protein